MNLKEAMRGLEAVLRDKDELILNQDYEQAAELRDREVKLRGRIAKLESGWHRDQSNEIPVVTDEDIVQTISKWTGIPVIKIGRGGPFPASSLESPPTQVKLSTDQVITAKNFFGNRLPLSTNEPAQIHVFVSYSNQDRMSFVDRLAEDLQHRGYLM